MKKNSRLFIFAGLCCLLNYNDVIAGNTPGAVTLTVSDGYYHFDNKWNLENTSMPAGAIAYNIDQHWAIEGSIGILNTEFRSDDDLHGDHVHALLYSIDGIYRFHPYGHLEPYVIAGIGLLSIEKMENDSNHPGNISAGFGAQLFWGDNVALRGEFRDIYMTTGRSRNDFTVGLGLSLLLGGKKHASLKGES